MQFSSCPNTVASEALRQFHLKMRIPTSDVWDLWSAGMTLKLLSQELNYNRKNRWSFLCRCDFYLRFFKKLSFDSETSHLNITEGEKLYYIILCLYAPSASEIIFTMLFYLNDLILILVLLLFSSWFLFTVPHFSNKKIPLPVIFQMWMHSLCLD